MKLRRTARGLLLIGAITASVPVGASHDAADCTPIEREPVSVSLRGLHGLRIGVALGSGSGHGLAHIGVLQEMEARGLSVDVVAGTSVGAVVGGLWASGFSADQVSSLSHGSDWEEAGEF